MYTMLQMMEGSVQTGDERNISLWIILAVAALLLAVVSAVISIVSKKKK